MGAGIQDGPPDMPRRTVGLHHSRISPQGEDRGKFPYTIFILKS